MGLEAFLLPLSFSNRQMSAMISYRLCSFLWFLFGMSLGFAYADSADEAYREWLRKPSSELLRMGLDYARLEVGQDSAMVCYSIIADRYGDRMTREEKELTARALNEMGVLNTCHYCNYTEAYKELLMARDICEEICLDEMKPHIFLNLGNLHNLYEFLFPSVERQPEAGRYYEQSFRTSCRLRQWDMVTASYINFTMLNMPYGVGDASVHREMAALLRDSIPRTAPDWQMAHLFLEGNTALLGGDPAGARGYYRQMMECLAPPVPERGDGFRSDVARDEYMVHTCIEATFLYEQRYDSAIVYAEKVLRLQSRRDLTDIYVETYRFLSEYYRQTGNEAEAARCHTAYLENKEQMMRSIVGLIPTGLSHDLETVSAVVRRMKEHEHLEKVNFIVAVFIITMLLVFVLFVAHKNRQLNGKNAMLYRQMKEIIHAERSGEADVRKYKESQLKEEKKRNLVEQIQRVMGDTGAICQPTFSLQALSECVGSNTSYVSQAINEHFGVSFTTLLNQYRIREVCRRMEDQATYGHLTIDAISEGVGFRTRITFTKSFRQNTGMLPSEYLKAVKKDCGR